MKVFKESEMTRGWFIGSFEPRVFFSKDCEVGLKRYKAGDYEEFHYHKVSTEITFIVDGVVKMNGNIFDKGNIIVIYPMEGTDFEAITDVSNLVVKIPSCINDKYTGNSNDFYIS